MKKITLSAILLFLTLSILSASFSPTVTLKSGINALIYDKKPYYANESGIEIGFISYRIKDVTLSLPLSVAYLTKSTESNYLFSPQHMKTAVGLEALYDNRKIGGSLSFFYGCEDFIDEKAVMKYMEGRLALHIILTDYLTLFIPVSYTYTAQGGEFSLLLGLRIGGER